MNQAQQHKSTDSYRRESHSEKDTDKIGFKTNY